MLNNFMTRNSNTQNTMHTGSLNQLLSVNGQSFTPTNPGDTREVRTVKVEQNYRKATQEEADAARVEAARAQRQAKIDQQYYGALAKHEKANARSQTAYRSYQGTQAQATFQKHTANANYGKRLTNLAPQYAKTHMTLNAAGHEAAVKFAEYQATYQGNR